MSRATELEAKIKEKHEMESDGQVWSWEACGVQGTDKCAVCGLTHHWGNGGQNTGSFSHWEDSHGDSITLAEASKMECG